MIGRDADLMQLELVARRAFRRAAAVPGRASSRRPARARRGPRGTGGPPARPRRERHGRHRSMHALRPAPDLLAAAGRAPPVHRDLGRHAHRCLRSTTEAWLHERGVADGRPWPATLLATVGARGLEVVDRTAMFGAWRTAVEAAASRGPDRPRPRGPPLVERQPPRPHRIRSSSRAATCRSWWWPWPARSCSTGGRRGAAGGATRSRWRSTRSGAGHRAPGRAPRRRSLRGGRLGRRGRAPTATLLRRRDRPGARGAGRRAPGPGGGPGRPPAPARHGPGDGARPPGPAGAGGSADAPGRGGLRAVLPAGRRGRHRSGLAGQASRDRASACSTATSSVRRARASSRSGTSSSARSRTGCSRGPSGPASTPGPPRGWPPGRRPGGRLRGARGRPRPRSGDARDGARARRGRRVRGRPRWTGSWRPPRAANAAGANVEALRHLRAALELATPDRHLELNERHRPARPSTATSTSSFLTTALALARASGEPRERIPAIISGILTFHTRWQGSVAGRPSEAELMGARRGRTGMARDHHRRDGSGRASSWSRPSCRSGSGSAEGHPAMKSSTAARGAAKRRPRSPPRLGDAALASAALDGIGTIDQMRGDFEGMRETAQQRLDMGDRLPVAERIDAACMVAWACVLIGDLERADAVAGSALAVVQPGQGGNWALHLAAWRALIATLRGDWDVALVAANKAHEFWLEHGPGPRRLFDPRVPGGIEHRRGARRRRRGGPLARGRRAYRVGVPRNQGPVRPGGDGCVRPAAVEKALEGIEARPWATTRSSVPSDSCPIVRACIDPVALERIAAFTFPTARLTRAQIDRARGLAGRRPGASETCAGGLRTGRSATGRRAGPVRAGPAQRRHGDARGWPADAARDRRPRPARPVRLSGGPARRGVAQACGGWGGSFSPWRSPAPWNSMSVSRRPPGPICRSAMSA